jgi:uncharacterized protein (TIGR01777 family)
VRVFITGGTGFLGHHLAGALLARGDDVVILTRRSAARDGPGMRHVVGDPAGGSWESEVAAADAVVNLAGASIAGGRWSPARKRELRESRLRVTSALIRALENARALARAPRAPRVLLSASGVGYYGAQGGEGAGEWIEETSAVGDGFLARLCEEWERTAQPARSLGVRTAFLRIGMVLGSDGGALAKMLPAFRFGLGGRIGDGRQWYSWIHVSDCARLMLHLLDNDISGPVNLVAPNPVTNAEFTATLARVLHRPALLPLPAFALRAALGEMSGVLLTGQRVRPAVAERMGFGWQFPHLRPALADLLTR